jgi:anthranilate phosphoribosyltransferase
MTSAELAADAEATYFAEFGGWPAVLSQLFSGRDLPIEAATATLGEILEGRAEPSQIGAFAAAMRTKGESIDEIVGLSRAMRERSTPVKAGLGAIDTCGTGGDRSGTVNVSTMAALVAAGAGVEVCKHGGAASSSLSGSADVLGALGVVVDLGAQGVELCLEEAGIGFCFAPRFHPAMRYAGPIRRQLGAPTIFNFLGPLCNPAGVTKQVVGVGDSRMAEKMLGVLEANGSTNVMVVYGHDGLDELSVSAPSTILHSVLIDGSHQRSVIEIDPRELGIDFAPQHELQGGDAGFNATRVHALLAGEVGPQRDFLLINSAAALLVAGLVDTLADGMALAGESVDSGAAMSSLLRLIAASRRASELESS